jgi:uncharacterized protein YcbK (DUF882 family)
MLLFILPLKVVLAATLSMAPPAPVDVTLYDANHKETYNVQIGLDGSVDEATREQLEHAFRCRRSQKEHKIDRGLLAMIAAVGQHWPGKTIEYISAYRGWKGERHTSPHLAGRAFDFRMQGVGLIELRDWVWSSFTHTGVGWYPGEDFVHMDHRPDQNDIAWTFKGHGNKYNPSWAARVREKHPTRTRESRVGL